MPTVTMRTTRTPHNGGRPTARPSALVRKTSLRGALRALGHEPGGTEATVDACLVWLAGVLVEIAAATGDARTATVLVDEASATLAVLSSGTPPPARTAGAGAAEAGAAASYVSLTPSELVVLDRLRGPAPLRGIADELHVSLNTVRSHTRAVYRKLGVGSRAEAVYRAQELELL